MPTRPLAVDTRQAWGNGAMDLANKKDVIAGRPWDVVIMHGYSTLDASKPGDPDKLVSTAQQMADLLRNKNPRMAIHLMATWTRADQTFVPTGH